LQGIEPEIAEEPSSAYQLTQALGPRTETSLILMAGSWNLDEECFTAFSFFQTNDLIEAALAHSLETLLAEAGLKRSQSDLIDLANQYNSPCCITTVAIQ